MLSRVAVTGLGGICGLGHNVQDIWNNLLNSKSGITDLECPPDENLKSPIAGEVKNFTICEKILSLKEQGHFDRFIHFALHSAFEAYTDAGLMENNPYSPEKIGCILGVGMGGFPQTEAQYETYLKKGLRRVSPFFIPAIIPNMSSGIISIKLGAKGVNYSASSACASSVHAIIQGVNEIALGTQDVIISGGAESVLSVLPYGGFAAMKALSKDYESPHTASRPFDSKRNGFIMGEGAGILILENYEKAKARGAKIYAEIVGHGFSSDASHITAPHPEGNGAATCMEMTLKKAQILPEQVDYINAHATSTPLGDIAETKAIQKVFGQPPKGPFVSSTKSSTGHLLGAAGGIESLFTIMAIKNQVIPATLNLDNPDPECNLKHVIHQKLETKVEYAINNAFGFGGTNASVLFKKVE